MTIVDLIGMIDFISTKYRRNVTKLLGIYQLMDIMENKIRAVKNNYLFYFFVLLY